MGTICGAANGVLTGGKGGSAGGGVGATAMLAIGVEIGALIEGIVAAGDVAAAAFTVFGPLSHGLPSDFILGE